MYHCIKCNKDFEKRHSYVAHCVSHYPKKPYKKKEKPLKEYKCKFCGWKGTPNTIGGHTLWCKSNPDRELFYQKVIQTNQKMQNPILKKLKRK